MGEGEGEGEGEMPNLLEIWLECASVDDALVALEVVLQRRHRHYPSRMKSY